MIRPVPLGRPATYDDLARAPEHAVAEILGGDLYVSPRPAFPQAYTDGRIHSALEPFRGSGGWWILFEPEIHFARDVAVPDLGGWRTERLPVFPRTAYTEVVPDWICEITSPTQVHVDRVRKMDLYAREGVPHVWLVDPLGQFLEVFRLESGRWVRVLADGGESRVRAEPFGELELDLGSWWPPAETA